MDLKIPIPIEGSLLFHLSFTILSIRLGEALVCSLRKLEFVTFFLTLHLLSKGSLELFLLTLRLLGKGFLEPS